MKLAALFLSLAVAMPGSPYAGESEGQVADATQLISAFQTICLDHLGDSSAQINVARAAPWNFAPVGQAVNDEAHFHSDLGAFGVRDSAKACMLTAEMSSHVTLASVRALMASSLQLDQGAPLDESDSVYWLVAPVGSSEQFVIGLKVSDRTGPNLATLTVQTRTSLTQ